MRLVGDIGGTNARFAIVEPGKEPSDVRKLPVAQYSDLIEAVQDYMSGRPPVDEAVLAVAAPVLSDQVTFTNSPWRFSVKDAQRRLGLKRLIVINDLVAQAWSFPALRAEEIGVLKPGMRSPERPLVVIAPGTGLGVAFLLTHGATTMGLPSEAGHASFAPRDRVQMDLLQHLQEKLGHVSVERLLSGPGLLTIATALAEIRGQLVELRAPRDVSAGAADGTCAICREAIRIFSHILGSTAGNLALTIMAGGVAVTGGLCRALRPLLDIPALTDGFTSKGRFRGYLSPLPIEQILRPHAALTGAALYREPERPDKHA